MPIGIGNPKKIASYFGPAPRERLSGAWDTLRLALTKGKIMGAMIYDAKVVAICRQHGFKILWQSDLRRHIVVQIANPLVADT